MKTIISFLFALFFSLIQAQKIPEILKTEFTDEALAQTILNNKGEEVTIKSIIESHRGKVIVFEFWAGWCRDCLVGIQAVHKLQESNPEVDFIYFSLDRNYETWKNGIEKYHLQGDHYWFFSGWKNPFNNYIDLNWVPRFMIIDQKGKIAKYYAISAEDPEIQRVINSLLE